MTWLYVPSSSARAWACLEKDCELGSPTWAERCAPSATLSGKLAPPQSWLRESKKAAWIRRLSGQTFSPSTLERGAEQWISSLRASHAKTSVSPASEPASMASVRASSSTSSTMPTLAVRANSFWRTSQASLLPPPPLWTRPAPPTIPPTPLIAAYLSWVEKMVAYLSARPPASWENWPTVGGMRNGSLFQRPTWAPRMGANGGSATPGAWMTPRAGDGPKGGPNQAGSKGDQMLTSQAAQWMTPTVMNAQGNAYTRDRGQAGQERPTLTGQAQQWPTPDTARRGTESPEQVKTRRDKSGAGGLPLQTAAACWPTPASRDGDPRRAPTRQDSLAWENKVARGSVNAAGMLSDDLSSSAANWPTPASRDYRTPNASSYQDRSGTTKGEQLVNFVAHRFSSPPAQPTPDGPASSQTPPGSPPPLTQRLNPYFVEWLMGWPLGWTSAAGQGGSSAVGTALWRSALQQRLSCLLDEPIGQNGRAAAQHRSSTNEPEAMKA